MSLQKRLEGIKAGFLEQAPQEVVDLMATETAKLKAEDFLKNIPKVGEQLKDGELTLSGSKVKLLENLDSSKAYIISFYRGGWCPYCRAELEELEKIKSDVESLGAEIIAITPEDQNEVKNTKERTGSTIRIFSDIGSAYARSLSLAHTLPKSLQDLYLQFGVNVEKHNGESLFDLPIPSTLIINQEKKIQYVFADGDYTERSNPDNLLNVLREL